MKLNFAAKSGPRKKGSVLFVALLFAAIIGISLASYLALSSSSMRLAHRSFLENQAMNLAEAGLENALYCFNQTDQTTAWNGWTKTGVKATNTFSIANAAANVSGTVKVYVENYNGSSGTPKVVAKGMITPGDGGPQLSKVIEITLSKRSIWGFGMIAKNSVLWDSNGYADSWNSDPDGNPATPPAPYSIAVARANAAIGVVAAPNGALNFRDNPTVHGTANTGGGTVSKSGSAKLSGTVGGSGWDTTRVHRDFSFTFPPIAVPSPSATNLVTSSITSTTTLPRAGDVAAADGKYYYNFAASANIVLGASTLAVNQPVVLLFTNHSGTNTIKTSDHATFSLGTSGTVEIYTNGNINIDSDSAFFANRDPASCVIYGTNPTSQSFIFRGAVTMNACVYEPNGSINIDSNSVISGSLIASSIAWGSGAKFHYDEALAGGDASKKQRVTKWKELKSAAERAAYASALAF